jgi:uncharacterized protein (DUF433 family)
MTVKEFERQLLALPPAEKVQIFHTLLVDLTKSTPGIEKALGVVGGDACIMRTRIPVWALEGYRRLGWTNQQILENFPSLRAEDLHNAWAYVATHEAEIEAALFENEEA